MEGPRMKDLSPDEREIIEWKEARRLKYRNIVQKHIADPITSSSKMVDKAVIRYAEMKRAETLFATNRWHYSVGKFFSNLATVGFIAFIYYIKTNEEKDIRSGKIPYIDRAYKFR